MVPNSCQVHHICIVERYLAQIQYFINSKQSIFSQCADHFDFVTASFFAVSSLYCRCHSKFDFTTLSPRSAAFFPRIICTIHNAKHTAIIPRQPLTRNLSRARSNVSRLDFFFFFEKRRRKNE